MDGQGLNLTEEPVGHAPRLHAIPRVCMPVKHVAHNHFWHAEIIHNPAVNQRLKEMDITIITEQEGVKDFSHVKADDVVILPAFGASLQETMLLSDRGVNIVDTTCPWVSKVGYTEASSAEVAASLQFELAEDVLGVGSHRDADLRFQKSC